MGITTQRKLTMIKFYLVVALSCLTLAAVSEPSEAQEMVHFPSAIPGINFDLPKGWVTCDPANSKLLGDAVDVFHQRTQLCTRADWESKDFFYAFDPNFSPTIGMLVDRQDAKTAASWPPVLTPDSVKLFEPMACEGMREILLGKDLLLKSCDITFTTFAGFPAMHEAMVFAPKAFPETYASRDTYELRQGQYAWLIEFAVPVQYASPVVMAEVDAIITSIKIAD